MAKIESSTNAGLFAPKSNNNLLDFMSNAVSTINGAMATKKKRPVNVRKYIQKRVKRLNGKPSSCSTQPKNKSVQKTTKVNAAKQLQTVGSQSWPMFAPPNNFTDQSQGFSSNYPTMCSPSYTPYNSETSLYPSPSGKPLNVDLPVDLDLLDDFLSELDSEPSTRHNSDSFPAGVSPGYPANVLESQVYLAEHPYSPPDSDSSDDIFERDSAYSSPVGSVGHNSRSAMSSPPMPADWHVPSPPTTQCPVNSTVWYAEQPPTTAADCWAPNQFTPFGQPQTVSDLLPSYYC